MAIWITLDRFWNTLDQGGYYHIMVNQKMSNAQYFGKNTQIL